MAGNRDEMLSTALWWQRLRETSNAAFLPLFFDRHRFLVLKGGGGSGKSVFAGRKVLERASTEPGHRFLVVRKVARTLRESCFEQLKSQAYEFYADQVAFIPRGKGSDMYIKFKNGSEIIFAGLDDVEKLKSIYDITGIWVEEASELLEGDLNQLDIRLRTDTPYYLQMILTFNPISITHWLKARFFDRRDPRARVHESTYKDNRFLTEEAVKTLEGFRDTDEYFYQVYALGQWGVTGKTVFDAKAISERLEQLRKPAKVGGWDYTLDGLKIRTSKWAEYEDGPVTIYKEPVPGRPYVIGGDTAGEGSDYFVAQVIDNITGEQVALLRHQYDEDTYARQIYCLGKYYNDALIATEVNFSTYPTKLLEMMGYNKLYVREMEDTFDGTIRHAFGFRTDRITRPVIISELVRALRGNYHLINDRTTLEEMLTFIRNEQQRPEAEPGAHDDTVMALAIAFYVRPQQTMEDKARPVETVQWTQDMWEDYYNAPDAIREILIQKWGNPA